MKSTFVSGDLRVFEKTPKLQLLTLFKTHVRGIWDKAGRRTPVELKSGEADVVSGAEPVSTGCGELEGR